MSLPGVERFASTQLRRADDRDAFAPVAAVRYTGTQVQTRSHVQVRVKYADSPARAEIEPIPSIGSRAILVARDQRNREREHAERQAEPLPALRSSLDAARSAVSEREVQRQIRDRRVRRRNDGNRTWRRACRRTPNSIGSSSSRLRRSRVRKNYPRITRISRITRIQTSKPPMHADRRRCVAMRATASTSIEPWSDEALL